MSRVEVSAGICGFTAIIEAKMREDGKIEVKITSNCKEVTNLAKVLHTVELEDVFKNMCETPVYKAASKHLPHSACPIPSAILKAIEVEACLAVPKDVSIKIEK